MQRHPFRGVVFLRLALLLRVAYGLFGPRAARFWNWFPITVLKLRAVGEDLLLLTRFQIPEREPHEGIAGLVQGLGLLAFIAIACTGTLIYFYLEPGTRATGWVRSIKEIHETAQVLIPVYLLLHVGGVVVHALHGQHLWRAMFFCGRGCKPR